MISIIIPSFNEGNVLLETVERLVENIKNSSEEIEYEIILVDSSTDDTFEKIKSSKYNKENQIKMIKSKQRMFPGQARNLGVEQAQYDIIVFTDVGFSFEEDWLINLTKPLIDEADIDLSWGITETSRLNSKDRMTAYLIESKSTERRILPNLAIRKKVFLDGHWFKNDLRAVEDTRFIHEIKDKYKEVFTQAINYYSGHPQSFLSAFKKWSTYSYYSYIAGYTRKATLSVVQTLAYLLILILVNKWISIPLILILQSGRVLLKSNDKYEISPLEFPYILILSFFMDIGRFWGSVKGIFTQMLSSK